jgi:hypothetical protein
MLDPVIPRTSGSEHEGVQHSCERAMATLNESCASGGWTVAPAKLERAQGRKVRAPQMTKRRVTPARGNPRESATESKPPKPFLEKAGQGERVR